MKSLWTYPTSSTPRKNSPPALQSLPAKYDILRQGALTATHGKAGDWDRPRIVLFVSAGKGEGTSTASREYALSVHHMLRRSVLLVEARSGGCELFPPDDGAAPRASAFEISRLPSLVPPAEFWATLREQYGDIVIDCPAADQSPLAVMLAHHADQVILVVEAERTRLPDIQRLRRTIENAGGTIAGAILNKRRRHLPRWLDKRL